MQFKSILAFGLLGAAYAAPASIDKRQATTIAASFDPIKASLSSLDDAIKGLTAANAKTAAADITAKSKAVEDALKTGAATVGKATAFTNVVEALPVSSGGTALATLTGTTIDDLVAKKSIIESVGQKKAVLDALTAQKTASEAYIAAISAKIPASVSSVATAQGKKVSDAISKGVTAYT